MSAASYEFGGATTITSAGNITASATSPDIDVNGDTTLTGNLVLSDGNFNLNSTGGDISVTGTITSAGEDETLTLTDGTGTGTITLGGSALSLIHI